MNNLQDIAKSIVAPGKGILAADESLPTIEKRFKAINLESTEETRRAYRELLFTTKGIGQYLSGIILFDETIRQKTKDKISFVEILQKEGVIPGIKVDKGTVELTNFPQEKITQGLDGLKERLAEYVTLGAKFTKWRMVITIGQGLPTKTAIESNSHVIARFASQSQEAGLVPIVEPEVLMEGDHTLDKCADVTYVTLANVFMALQSYKVDLSGLILKTNFVTSGSNAASQAPAEEVAQKTLETLLKVVPKEVPGIVFLSGGQAPEVSTSYLNAINSLSATSKPWQLSFSFGRALQDPVLKIWNGKSENMEKAQEALLKRARLNSLARDGKYNKEGEFE